MLIFPLLLIVSSKPTPYLTSFEIFVFFITGVSAWLYQTFATIAFQNENAGRVSMINYLQVDILYVIDILLFNKTIIALDLIGTLMIFSFNFANGLYKTIKRISISKRELEKMKQEKNKSTIVKNNKEKVNNVSNNTISNNLV